MADKEKPDSHFDSRTFMRSLDYEMDFIKSILEACHESLDEFLTKSKPLIENLDKTELKKAAHKLKGTSLSLRFNILAALAKDMESIDNATPEEIATKHKAMVEEIHLVKSLIDKELEQI